MAWVKESNSITNQRSKELPINNQLWSSELWLFRYIDLLSGIYDDNKEYIITDNEWYAIVIYSDTGKAIRYDKRVEEII